MARKKNKKKKKTTSRQATAAVTPIWQTGLSWMQNPRIARNTLLLFVAAILLFGAGMGMLRLERHVHGLPQFERVLALEWHDLPNWLRLPENRHILETLTQRVGLRNADRLTDRDLSERLGIALSARDIGWVKSVDRITVRPDGVVSVDCRFRRPTAWVKHGNNCYLVDAEGVRLPGRYDPEECATSSLLMISGLLQGPPKVGMLWEGADLSSGLRLASLIADRPFKHQVDQIVVTNHDGRRNRDRPHIELATDREGSRIWWGRPPDEEYGTEISSRQKLALLDTLFDQWGRIDLNRPYVDIRSHPVSVVMPSRPQGTVPQ